MADSDDTDESDDITVSEEELEQVREEARAVVDHQLSTLQNTDDKALQTTRIVALVLGLLLSALSLADDPGRIFNDAFVVGGLFLIGSFVLGLFTYTVDRPEYGLGPGYFDEDLKTMEDGTEISQDLLERYADWIDANSGEINTNANYLFFTLLLLVVGLIIISYAVYTSPAI